MRVLAVLVGAFGVGLLVGFVSYAVTAVGAHSDRWVSPEPRRWS